MSFEQKKKIIYSKHFPKIDINELSKELVASSDSLQKPLMSIEEVWRKPACMLSGRSEFQCGRDL